MSPPLPLDGLRVVELSHMVMGPTCGMILADLGAEVVKIEPMGTGDNTRRLPGTGAGFFPTFNRNKRSLALDLKHPKALALTRRLIARADILVENFRPGGLDTIGLGYEALAGINPRLVYCSLKGFLAGPYEQRSALDEVVQMMGGLAYMTGPPGRPLRAGAPVNDMMGGMFGALAILAAVVERGRTGRGQHVKSALFENTCWLVAPHMAQFKVTGRAADPMPNRISAWAIYDVFESADGLPVFVGVVSDTQWRAFCDEFARADLLVDPALATNPMRVAERPRLLRELGALFKGLTRAEIVCRCDRARLAYAPVTRPDELFDDPQLQGPGAMVEVSLPDGRPMAIPALPVELGGRRLGRRRDVPGVGEHSLELARELGLGDGEIAVLVAEGAIDPGGRPRSETDVLPAATAGGAA
jgi:crotonobetainyl-CoA:carnitine CoA-transferase CaiB-like acyl-CoA transferase